MNIGVMASHDGATLQAVLDACAEGRIAIRDTETGISIHHVDMQYDTGMPIAQCRVPVLHGDSVETLKARVRAREKPFVVETLAAIAAGR